MRIRITALTLVSLFAALSAHAQFTQLKSYGVGTGLDQFVEADLNHDGKPDIVGSGYANSIFNVTALLGDGKGGFSTPIVSAISGITVNGAPPQAVADFNNDGFPDFAFVGTDPVTGAVAVGIMFGKGNGSFEAPEKIILPKATTSGELAAGDFTGHGNIDLVYANGVNVMVLPGKGNGKFGAAIISSISQDVRCIAVGDFNNDGKLDLTVGTSVMLGNGNGTFQSPITVPGGECNVAVADLNHDGNLDLITGSSHKSIQVYLGNGTGNFEHFKPYVTGNNGSIFPSFAVADYNGDGHPDIAVLNGSASDVTILLNKGNGTFNIGQTLNGGSFDIAAGEFSGNKTQDLVVSSGVINVLVGKGNGTFNDNLAQNNVVSASHQIVADFNNDGKLDLLTFAPDGAVQLGNGDGTFGPPILLPSSCRLNQNQDNSLQSVAVGDFNGDHNLDIAVIVANDLGVGVGVGVCLGKGDGTFEDAVFYDQGIEHETVVTGDFNNDGKLDLAVSDQGGISILLGNGNGTFRDGIPTALNAPFPIFTVGDFNNDGKLDIAALTGNTVTVLLGKGNGKFENPITSTNTDAQFVVAGDLNKDGNLDLITVNSNVANTISVLLGNGDGTFKTPVTYPDEGATQVALGDFNGDGILDLAYVIPNELFVLSGKGDGTFKSTAKFSTFSGHGWLEPGDFNGSGALDLADLTGRRGSAKLVVFLNTK